MSPQPFVETIISLGSNIEKERYLPEAIRLLRRHRRIEVRRVSRFFESAPVGGPDDAPDFFNAAVVACTDLSPEELRDELRHLEEVLGRKRTEDKDAPRTIDLDIAYYGELQAAFDGWQVPDPGAGSAPHVAIPIADVAPTWVDPVSSKTAYDLMLLVDAAQEAVKPVLSITLATPYESRGPEEFDQTGDVYAPQLEAIVRAQLLEIGENPDREGLVRTPLRVAKALDFLTNGYSTSLSEVVNNAVFDGEGADEMVLVKDIEFYSMCEHHMLPFFGKAAVAYLPKGKIIGLSKVARVVDLFARRLQVQERLTNQVADAMSEILDPLGVGVVIEGQHLCMMMRGVQKQDSSTVTSAMRGTFRSDPRTRSEFISLANR
ncbi:MAG: GTP cyclohydrolase I FolE [bacterium]|nr:GTP cyclohydrolase I FolE [bacterium]